MVVLFVVSCFLVVVFVVVVVFVLLLLFFLSFCFFLLCLWHVLVIPILNRFIGCSSLVEILERQAVSWFGPDVSFYKGPREGSVDT